MIWVMNGIDFLELGCEVTKKWLSTNPEGVEYLSPPDIIGISRGCR